MQNTTNLYKGDNMTGKSLNLRIDEERHTKFKACTVLNGESMTDALIRMIDEYIETNEKKMG